MGKVKIVSDGTIMGTAVIDMDTEKELNNVTGVKLRVHDGELIVEVTITKPVLEMELNGGLKVHESKLVSIE